MGRSGSTAISYSLTVQYDCLEPQSGITLASPTEQKKICIYSQFP